MFLSKHHYKVNVCLSNCSSHLSVPPKIQNALWGELAARGRWKAFGENTYWKCFHTFKGLHVLSDDPHDNLTCWSFYKGKWSLGVVCARGDVVSQWQSQGQSLTISFFLWAAGYRRKRPHQDTMWGFLHLQATQCPRDFWKLQIWVPTL